LVQVIVHVIDLFSAVGVERPAIGGPVEFFDGFQIRKRTLQLGIARE
jgi:hypothetical protein